MPNPASSTHRPRVLILGAAGRFGAASVAAFAAAGFEVLAQARRAPADLPSGARHLPIALEDTAALAEAARGASHVIYAVNPPYTQWRDHALRLARLGMEVAERLGATFMLPGNVYNFGARMPARLAKDTPQEPSTEKGRLRVEMERELHARATRPDARLRAVVIRAGDFFGGGTGSWFDLVIAKDLARGKVVYPGPFDVPHAWAFVPDLAETFVRAARRDLGAFCVLHFEGHTLTGAQLLDALEQVAARRGIVRRGGLARGGVPWAVMRLGGLVVPMWREIADMAYLWRTPHALDGTTLRAALSAPQHTPLEEALDAALTALGIGGAGAAQRAA